MCDMLLADFISYGTRHSLKETNTDADTLPGEAPAAPMTFHEHINLLNLLLIQTQPAR